MGRPGRTTERRSTFVGALIALTVAAGVLVPAFSSEGSERVHYEATTGPGPAVGTAPFVPAGAVSATPAERATDDRTRITPTTTYPATAIGYLVTWIQGVKHECTGTMIGRHTVLTAAHCIFENNRRAARGRFYPGRDGGFASPQEGCPTTGYYLLPEYIVGEEDQNDMGAVRLGAPCGQVGTQTGWFGTVGGADWTGDTIWTTGYPGEIGAGDQQWEGEGTIVATSGLYLRTDVYATAGQSGAAVYCYYDPPSPSLPLGYYIVGVHVSSNRYHTRAYASRITRARLNTIGVWRSY